MRILNSLWEKKFRRSLFLLFIQFNLKDEHTNTEELFQKKLHTKINAIAQASYIIVQFKRYRAINSIWHI